MMDRALKERIVGAIVLVVVAILIVPVFLDGSVEQDTQTTETITLPGQEEQVSPQKTVVLDLDREEPVPQAHQMPLPSSDTSDKSATTAQQTPPKQTTQAPPKQQQRSATVAAPPSTSEKPNTTASSGSSTGMFAVQLGSFSSEENAERLAASLRKQGYAAFISEVSSGSKTLHRVRVGPQKDRASAEVVATKLAAEDHSGQVVPHP